MKSALLLAMLVLTIAPVYAAGLTAVSPTDGTLLTELKGDFSFTTPSTQSMKCALLIDSKPVKNTTYTEGIGNRNIKYTIAVENGEHTWQVRCETDKEVVDTPLRKFTVQGEVQDTTVTVTSSGVTRGSLLHSFDFTNSPTQTPVTVPKLAPGDYVEITLILPPSRMTTELYVKQLTSKNDKKYLWVQDSKLLENYHLYEGEPVTVAVGSSRVNITFTGTDSNKATIVVSPTTKMTQAQPEPVEPVTEPVVEPEPIVEPVVEEPPIVEAPPVQPPKAEPPKAEVPKQSGFKRFLSWLSNLFG